jgi:hypothetical protein
MKNIEKALKEELRNNDCIEYLVNTIDAKKSIYDAFVVDGKLVIVFDNELQTNEVEDIQSQLKKVKGCGEVFNDEFDIGYKGNFKSLTLDLLTDNISIGKFEHGGELNKMSSIEWLANQINTSKWKFADITDKNNIIEEAKKMHKQEIISAMATSHMYPQDDDFEGYYNNKYNQKNHHKGKYAQGGELNKISSIEWLFNQMGNLAAGYVSEMNAGEILYHAKQMHKKEIIDAWMNGDMELTELSANNFATKYYNQTFMAKENNKKFAKGGEMAKGGQMSSISQKNQIKRNLKSSGAFTLELEMAVYVPSTTTADQIIPKTLFQKRIQEVEKYLSKLFGGYSSTSVEGGYVSQEKGLIKEDVAKVTAFGTEESLKKNFKPLMRQISKWCEAWGQESMGFEFEGDLYYVSKTAKFSKGGKIDKRPKFVKNGKK